MSQEEGQIKCFIDGANVAKYPRGNAVTLKNVTAVINALHEDFFGGTPVNIYVILKPVFRYLIPESEQPIFNDLEDQGILVQGFRGKGAIDDRLLLRFAAEFHQAGQEVWTVTNDRYKDHLAEFPWYEDFANKIQYVIIDNRVKFYPSKRRVSQQTIPSKPQIQEKSSLSIPEQLPQTETEISSDQALKEQLIMEIEKAEQNRNLQEIILLLKKLLQLKSLTSDEKKHWNGYLTSLLTLKGKDEVIALGNEFHTTEDSLIINKGQTYSMTSDTAIPSPKKSPVFFTEQPLDLPIKEINVEGIEGYDSAALVVNYQKERLYFWGLGYNRPTVFKGIQEAQKRQGEREKALEVEVAKQQRQRSTQIQEPTQKQLKSIDKTICPYCNEKFPTQAVKEQHIRDNHKSFVCSTCKRRFTTQQGLDAHKRSKDH